MLTLRKLAGVELKLFTREPLTVVFSFVFPLIVLFVLAGVFGNKIEQPDPGEVDPWRGVGPTDYYVPAYVGLVIAAIGLISLPVHLASYRERGVLRRFRASQIPAWGVLGSQLVVSFVLAAVSGLLLTVVAMLVYDTRAPDSVGRVIVAFLLATLSFSAIGLFLGAVLPTARAAQGAGLILFFIMMFICGAGPPREVLSEAMERVSDFMPLTHVITTLQDPWLGLGWDGFGSLVVLAFLVGAAALALRLFRWE